jgi:3-hydroxyisobutyrate dehydrogenase-like beta-hydroxyacid dehydrogenase
VCDPFGNLLLFAERLTGPKSEARGEAVGAATLVKLIENFLITSAGYSMSEALQVAEKAGVDPKAVCPNS